jgi:hypothetical protein
MFVEGPSRKGIDDHHMANHVTMGAYVSKKVSVDLLSAMEVQPGLV